MKVTTPPFIGSAELFAFTVTASELVKATPTKANCGVLAATGVEREALALEGTDVRAAVGDHSPRWSEASRTGAPPAWVAAVVPSAARTTMSVAVPSALRVRAVTAISSESTWITK